METMELNRAFWLDRPTFVTGGTGLLGTWLVKQLLEAGAKVMCLVRNQTHQNKMIHTNGTGQIKFIPGDIRDRPEMERILQEYEIDTVMHLAAQAIVTIANREPIQTFETNIAGTWNILEACRNCSSVKQIVVSSSDKAYGDHETLPYDENTPLQGRHPYEVSKSAADLITQAYAVSFGLPVAITRCGNFYGGGDLNWNRIIPGTIRSIIEGQRPVIRTDGEFIRDYFYVEDGAAVYLLLAEQLAARPELKGQAFNFSNEIQVSVREIVNQILKEMQSDLSPDIRNEVSNEIRRQYLSAEKARHELNWKPMFNLEDGLRKTIDWYKDYFENERES